jgi:hypothetical protein
MKAVGLVGRVPESPTADRTSDIAAAPRTNQPEPSVRRRGAQTHTPPQTQNETLVNDSPYKGNHLDYTPLPGTERRHHSRHTAVSHGVIRFPGTPVRERSPSCGRGNGAESRG